MSTLLSLGWLVGCTPDETPADTDTTPTAPAEWVAEAPLQALRSQLDSDGWGVWDGKMSTIDLESCCDFPSCHARNPNSAYVMFDVPLVPGEAERTVDDAFKYRMRADEALVYIGRTPPPARYFSYRSYAHTVTPPPDGEPIPAYLNLGESINQAVVGTWGDSPTAPFDSTVVVISVADAGTERRVREHLLQAGFLDQAINTDIVPPAYTRLGLDKEHDQMRLNLRVSRFDDLEGGEAWLDTPPGVVLRLHPPEPIAPAEPLEVAPKRGAGGGPTEAYLLPTALELRDAVHERWSQYPILDAVISSNQPPAEGPCWPGCNSDSTYASTTAFPMPEALPHADVVVFGVNHEATGMASYANAILMGNDNEDPVAFVDTSMVAGSADSYLPGHPDVDKFYVWRFARDCGEDPFCSTVNSGCPGLEPGELSHVNWRTYLDPRTGTHADLDDLILDQAIFVLRTEDNP